MCSGELFYSFFFPGGFVVVEGGWGCYKIFVYVKLWKMIKKD